ncbi:hypothetical protein AB0F25_17320 [Streptomyces wedmorensis]|uniref:hypothetical protein n=1 Tax=Streptomyces wedmorensis TaxID=43759 RepID=UPI00342D23D4
MAEPDRRVGRVAQAAGGLLAAADEVAVPRQAFDERPGGRVTDVEQDAHLVRGDGSLDDRIAGRVRDGHGPLDPGHVLGEGGTRPVRHGQRRHRACQGNGPVDQFVHRAGQLYAPLDDLAHLVAQQQPEVQADLSAHRGGQAGVGDDVPEDLQRVVGAKPDDGTAGQWHGQACAGLFGNRTGRQSRLEQMGGFLLLAGLFERPGGAFDCLQPASLVAAGTAVLDDPLPGDGLASYEQLCGPPVHRLQSGPAHRVANGGCRERRCETVPATTLLFEDSGAQSGHQGGCGGSVREPGHDGELMRRGGLVQDGRRVHDRPVFLGHGGGAAQRQRAQARRCPEAIDTGREGTAGLRGVVCEQVEQVDDGLRDATGHPVQGLGQAGWAALLAENRVRHAADGGHVERTENVPHDAEGGWELRVGPQYQPGVGELLGAVAEDAREVRRRSGEQCPQRGGVLRRRPMHVLDQKERGPRTFGGRSLVNGPTRGSGQRGGQSSHEPALAGAGEALDQKQDGAAGPIRSEASGQPCEQRGLGVVRRCNGVRHVLSPRPETRARVLCVYVLILP